MLKEATHSKDNVEDSVEQDLSFDNPDDVDVTTLDHDGFIRWLEAKRVPLEACQALKGTYLHKLHLIHADIY